MSYHIEYDGELFISEKNTPIKAIEEYKIFREKTTNKPLKFFLLKIKKVN